MVEENFLITIVGLQSIKAENDRVNLRAVGSYQFSDEEKKICFYEYDTEDVDIKTKSTLLISKDDKIIFTKSGSVKTQLIFKKGQRHMCHYITEFGSLQIGTFTDRINIDLNEKGGKIDIYYTIDINSSTTSYNQIHIEIQEAKKEDV